MMERKYFPLFRGPIFEVEKWNILKISDKGLAALIIKHVDGCYIVSTK